MEVCNMADTDHQSIQSLIMKLAVVLFACVAVALAQQHGGNQGGNHGGMQHGGHGPDAIMHMIHMEVQALMSANPGMSSADCIKKCDDMFDLMDSTDETSTDQHCKGACECDIDHNCHHPTGQPGQHNGGSGFPGSMLGF